MCGANSSVNSERCDVVIARRNDGWCFTSARTEARRHDATLTSAVLMNGTASMRATTSLSSESDMSHSDRTTNVFSKSATSCRCSLSLLSCSSCISASKPTPSTTARCAASEAYTRFASAFVAGAATSSGTRSSCTSARAAPAVSRAAIVRGFGGSGSPRLRVSVVIWFAAFICASLLPLRSAATSPVAHAASSASEAASGLSSGSTGQAGAARSGLASAGAAGAAPASAMAREITSSR